MAEDVLLDADSVMVLLTLGLGAYIQAVTGFAMGLVAVGVVAIAGWVPVATVAAVVSAATFFNVAAALPGRLQQVDWGDSGLMSADMVPAVFGGVALLEYMSAGLAELLHTMLHVATVSVPRRRVTGGSDANSDPPVRIGAGLAALEPMGFRLDV